VFRYVARSTIDLETDVRAIAIRRQESRHAHSARGPARGLRTASEPHAAEVAEVRAHVAVVDVAGTKGDTHGRWCCGRWKVDRRARRRGLRLALG